MRALTLDSTTLAMSQDSAPSTGRGRLWTGRVLSGLSMLFLTWDGVMKLVQPPVVVKASAQLGYTAHAVFVLGVLLLAFVALYLVPRTAVLGAVLLTGFLGGAVAINVRLGNPLFSHTLFPIYVAALFWGGLYLRDRRLSQLLRADWP
jgi:hypothetical protein